MYGWCVVVQAIEVWLGMVWGKHDEDRRLLHDLLVSLHAKKLVTSAQIEKGLQPTIEFLNVRHTPTPAMPAAHIGEHVHCSRGRPRRAQTTPISTDSSCF